MSGSTIKATLINTIKFYCTCIKTTLFKNVTLVFLLRDTIFTHDLFIFEKKNIYIYSHARFPPISYTIITVAHYIIVYQPVLPRTISASITTDNHSKSLFCSIRDSIFTHDYYSFTTDNLSKSSLYNVQVFLRIHNQHY